MIDWRAKGFLHPDPVSAFEYGAARHSLFEGAFTWPLMVARKSALDGNVAALAAFTREHGLSFAPHGKTMMSPELAHAQLAAGAWAITAATASQALSYFRLGVPRVLLANEVLDPAALRVLAEEPGELLIYADSAEGVAVLAESGGRFKVLVELGHAGGRTGCRTLAEVERVAEAVRAADRLELAGVAGYEGTLAGEPEVRAFLRTLADAAKLMDPHPIISAGGSSWPHLVAQELSGEDGVIVLRSGAYISHDDGLYARTSPLCDVLRPALEVWAQVLSTPEPGLAIVGMGKRDVPYDIDLPVAKGLRRGDAPAELPEIVVEKVMDQHTFLRMPEGALRPGDLMMFGISHPCTAFDKWRVIPVADDDDIVVDVITTYF